MARLLQFILFVERSLDPPISDWILPLRREADQLMREGRFEEASRILGKIRKALRYEFLDNKGGEHEPICESERVSLLYP